MEKLGLNQLRSLFMEFFEGKGHYPRKSFSLVPEKDRSLLIVNSGMAPLKPYFAGLETPPSLRMATCQKCIRTGDIENVGHTSRHGTFFEMLGSFSFGDYFKRESLAWGWEFVTEVLKMPPDRLWASVYEEDDEAAGIWIDDIGLPPERLIRLGKDDNFWEIGTGPCGPCSEIYYDRGEAFGCGREDCLPGCECDRYVEFWNHVFTQYSRDEQGNYTPLEKKNIDTGMGLERLACIMQDTDSIFNIDTISYVLQGVCDAGNLEYGGGDGKNDVSIRIITDHIRSVAFMTGDGIIPSNEGRGYVLRRLLRRAARHGRLIGIEGAFLPGLADRVIEISKDAYPELGEKRDHIRKIIGVEEEKFSATIEQGGEILESCMSELSAAGERTLSGDRVFKLYDTYGFPLELTREILGERGFSADEEGFAAAMERQRETARAARKAGEDEGWTQKGLAWAAGATEFVGYDRLSDSGAIETLLVDDSPVDSVKAGDRASMILDRTPFYAESGGQEGDRGLILAEGARARVLDTVKAHDAFVHRIEVEEGAFHVGAAVSTEVDAERRHRTERNHTATHLLQKALREVLGPHVEQAGSSVTAVGLRFDFTHFEAVGAEALAKVEGIANRAILSFLPVRTEEKPTEEAMRAGATALFGEKYGAMARVVSIGDFSMELCGGTHLANSGQAGVVKIVSESGVAAGVRRIEALTGTGLLGPLAEADSALEALSSALKANRVNLVAKAASLIRENREAKKEIDLLKKEAAGLSADSLLSSAVDVGGVKLVRRTFKDSSPEDLRALCDSIREGGRSVVAAFASESGGKAVFVVAVADDLLDRGYHAGNIVKQLAAAAGGGGGGKADIAQAGAKDPARIAAAMASLDAILQQY
ncbi:MAG: alanine--tRNA ligase [Clostridiales Family XIII bacterium]|nr:alanine--tRNA ligase [Clostridiales Family XIII bacterium]